MDILLPCIDDGTIILLLLLRLCPPFGREVHVCPIFLVYGTMAHLEKYCETSNLAEPERLHLRILYDKTEY